jgi:hypothetical protein
MKHDKPSVQIYSLGAAVAAVDKLQKTTVVTLYKVAIEAPNM